MGVFEVDMFSKEVDSPYHPEAMSFRQILEEVAEEYGCHLIAFSVNQGTVSFSYDSDELTAKILKILENRQGGV
jgi:hypothetical protein